MNREIEFSFEYLFNLPDLQVEDLVDSITGGLAIPCKTVSKTIDGKHHVYKIDCGKTNCPDSSNYQSPPPKPLPMKKPDKK